MNLKTSDSINKAIELYIASLDESKQSSTRSNLKSALKMTVFRKVDFGQKQLKEFGQFLEQIAIAEFLQQAQDNFNSFIDKTPNKERGKSTVRNYKSHFKRFISWLLLQKLELNIEQKSVKDIFKRNDIPERAPRRNSGVHLQLKHKGRRRYSATVYCLTKKKLAQLEHLNQQLKQVENYLRADYKSTRDTDEPIRKTTWEKYELDYRRFLGWQKNIEKTCDRELSLILMSDLKTLNSYLEWHSLRGNSIRTSLDICSAALNIAKCFQGIKSEPVQEIHHIKKKFSQNLRKDSHRRTSSKQALAEKLLTFNQCVEVVQYLRNCCAPKSFWGVKRSTSNIINSWKNYFLVSLLPKDFPETFAMAELQFCWWVESSDKF